MSCVEIFEPIVEIICDGCFVAIEKSDSILTSDRAEYPTLQSRLHLLPYFFFQFDPFNSSLSSATIFFSTSLLAFA